VLDLESCLYKASLARTSAAATTSVSFSRVLALSSWMSSQQTRQHPYWQRLRHCQFQQRYKSAEDNSFQQKGGCAMATFHPPRALPVTISY
jgi:hypothetical protein